MSSTDNLLYTPYIIKIIFSFTTVDESCKAREVCKTWANILPQVAFHRVPDWRGDGLYVDADRMIHNVPPFSRDVLELHLTIKTMDQGWGNKKGRVWLVLNQPANFVSNQLTTAHPFPVADHNFREDSVILPPDHDLVKKAVSGTFLQVWVHVGGGGGHSLRICDFEIMVKYKPCVFEMKPPATYSYCDIM